eukprot:tig00020629_g12388.t2
MLPAAYRTTQVHLQGLFDLREIRIINRLDANTAMLNNFNVTVYDNNEALVFWSYVGTPTFLDYYQNFSLPLPAGTTGSRIRIDMPNTANNQHLCMMELKAFAYPLLWSHVRPSAPRDSTPAVQAVVPFVPDSSSAATVSLGSFVRESGTPATVSWSASAAATNYILKTQSGKADASVVDCPFASVTPTSHRLVLSFRVLVVADAPTVAPVVTAGFSRESGTAATVSWTAGYDGGSALSKFVLKAKSGKTDTAAANCPFPAVEPSKEYTSLSASLNLCPGYWYEFSAAACNDAGCGAVSAATPRASVNAVLPSAPAMSPINFGAFSRDAGVSSTVSWVPGYDGGSVIIKYVLKTRSGKADASADDCPFPAIDSSQEFVSTLAAFNLCPGYWYEVSVSACAAVGCSEEVSEPQAIAPVVSPVAFGAFARASGTTATVDWTAGYDGGSAITQYVVNATSGKADASIADCPFDPVDVSKEYSSAPAILNLCPGYWYDFTVSSCNAAGCSVAAVFLRASAAAAVPDATDAPTVVLGDFTRVTGTAATVSWAAGYDGGSIISKYVLKATSGKADDGVADCPFDPVDASKEYTGTSAALNLCPGYWYQFSVSQCTAGADSCSVDAHAPRTTVPSVIPDAAAASDVAFGEFARASGTAATVSWTAGYDGGSVVVKSVLKAQSDKADPRVADCPFPAVNSSYEYAAPSADLILCPGYWFDFTVSSCNAAGCSADATIPRATAPAAVADAPSVSPAVLGAFSHSSGTATNISWTSAGGYDGGSMVTKYVLRAQSGKADNAITECPFASLEPTTEIVYTASSLALNLCPGYWYDFSVAACNGAGCSAEATLPRASIPAAVPDVPSTPTVAVGEFVAASGTAATVGWAAGYDGGSPIAKFVLTVQSGKSDAGIANCPYAVDASRDYSAESTSAALYLCPGYWYEFSASACNQAGCGATSLPSRATVPAVAPFAISSPGPEFSSPDSAPPFTLSVGTFAYPAGTPVTISGWAAPWDGGAPITSFKLKVWRKIIAARRRLSQDIAIATEDAAVDDDSSAAGLLDDCPVALEFEEGVPLTFDCPAGSCNVGLCPGQEYMFSVVACNAVGCSNDSAPVHTQGALPVAAPVCDVAKDKVGGRSLAGTSLKSLTGEDALGTYSTAIVFWPPLLYSGGAATTGMTFNMRRYPKTNTNTYALAQIFSADVSDSTGFEVFSDLQPSHCYTVNVTVCTSGGCCTTPYSTSWFQPAKGEALKSGNQQCSLIKIKSASLQGAFAAASGSASTPAAAGAAASASGSPASGSILAVAVGVPAAVAALAVVAVGVALVVMRARQSARVHVDRVGGHAHAHVGVSITGEHDHAGYEALGRGHGQLTTIEVMPVPRPNGAFEFRPVTPDAPRSRSGTPDSSSNACTPSPASRPRAPSGSGAPSSSGRQTAPRAPSFKLPASVVPQDA